MVVLRNVHLNGSKKCLQTYKACLQNKVGDRETKKIFEMDKEVYVKHFDWQLEVNLTCTDQSIVINPGRGCSFR